jgi:hypothetical protein
VQCASYLLKKLLSFAPVQHHGTSVDGGVQLESVIAVAKVFSTAARSIVFNAPFPSVVVEWGVCAMPTDDECFISTLVGSVGMKTFVPVVSGRLDPELIEGLDAELSEEDDDDPPEAELLEEDDDDPPEAELLEEDDDDPPELRAEDAEAGVGTIANDPSEFVLAVNPGGRKASILCKSEAPCIENCSFSSSWSCSFSGSTTCCCPEVSDMIVLPLLSLREVLRVEGMVAV